MLRAQGLVRVARIKKRGVIGRYGHGQSRARLGESDAFLVGKVQNAGQAVVQTEAMGHLPAPVFPLQAGDIWKKGFDAFRQTGFLHKTAMQVFAFTQLLGWERTLLHEIQMQFFNMLLALSGTAPYGLERNFEFSKVEYDAILCLRW